MTPDQMAELAARLRRIGNVPDLMARFPGAVAAMMNAADLIASMEQRVPMTEEQVVAAARVMNDRQAEVCGVDKDDQWKIYSDDFKDDARAMLEAAHGIRSDK